MPLWKRREDGLPAKGLLWKIQSHPASDGGLWLYDWEYQQNTGTVPKTLNAETDKRVRNDRKLGVEPAIVLHGLGSRHSTLPRLYGSNTAELQQVTLHLTHSIISLTDSISWDDDCKGTIRRRNGNRNFQKEITLSSSTFQGGFCKGNSRSKTVCTEGNLLPAWPACLKEKLQPHLFTS